MNTSFKTRQDFSDTVKELTNAIGKYFSEGCAGCNIGHTGVGAYSDRVIGLETFARLLWGIIPLTAGGGKSDLQNKIIKGIKNGSNPKHSEYWGEAADYDQMFVEMAAFALGLLICPDLVWEPLNAEEKENFNNWLLQINRRTFSQNNWQFFKVLVNAGLKKVGARYDNGAINDTLDLIDKMYLSDGWYSDGITNQRDYYTAFAMHYYSLIYAVTMRDDDPKRSAVLIRRSKRFAEDFIYFFNDDGKALPFGRSLTYRFAQCAFFSALAYAGEHVYSWGVTKGIICRHMRWWFKNPILDCENKLTLGYTYPNLIMCEGYNAPGSPYWALKSFIVLALDENHPFWQAKEEPLPRLDKYKTLKYPFMIIDRRDPCNITAYTSGQYADFEPAHADAKYGKFAYSSYFGFSVPKAKGTIGQCAPDSMLAFKYGDMVYTRRKSLKTEVGDGYIYSEWSPMPQITVKTKIEPYGEGHIRTHEIISEIDCAAYECGFSLPVDEENDVKKKICASFAEAKNEYGAVHTELLEGRGEGIYIKNEANTNLVWKRTGMCAVKLDIKKGKTHIKSYVFGIREKA